MSQGQVFRLYYDIRFHIGSDGVDLGFKIGIESRSRLRPGFEIRVGFRSSFTVMFEFLN